VSSAITSQFSSGQAILVVEDDEIVRDQVLETLVQAGFKAFGVLDRQEILAYVEQGHCLAIVLDIGLPGDDGMSIAGAIRKISSVPILMLTGRVGVASRVAGLEVGADDYLLKPHAPEELVARLRAVLRRSGIVAGGASASRSIRIGTAQLDALSGTLHGEQGSVRLTSHEARLIELLARTPGIVSRASAYREVFAREWNPTDRSLDVHMANLRRKLGAVGLSPDVILTVRGQGYELRAPVRLDGL
jgi:DNA-binding response OmpR family regulator